MTKPVPPGHTHFATHMPPTQHQHLPPSTLLTTYHQLESTAYLHQPLHPKGHCCHLTPSGLLSTLDTPQQQGLGQCWAPPTTQTLTHRSQAPTPECPSPPGSTALAPLLLLGVINLTSPDTYSTTGSQALAPHAPSWPATIYWKVFCTLGDHSFPYQHQQYWYGYVQPIADTTCDS